jgi:hypothetical protein
MIFFSENLRLVTRNWAGTKAYTQNIEIHPRWRKVGWILLCFRFGRNEMNYLFLNSLFFFLIFRPGSLYIFIHTFLLLAKKAVFSRIVFWYVPF